MELPIRVIVIVIVILVVALIVLLLLGVFGERSNWVVEGIFNFFNSLFGGQGPLPSP
ncbi:MAG: hypothetical protein KAU24_01515 [Candidatus Aenigmarchaeota archaeon]|nr:hypothetical protein [Candidatus Aenigmarchaeota archaeon]